MTVDYLSQDSTSVQFDGRLTIIIGHLQFGRSVYLDEILEQMGLVEHYFITAALHSVLYSSKIGLLGEWNNSYFDEMWDYALPYAIYEYGSDFDKMLISNEHHIKAYAKSLYLYYQNYLFSAMHSRANFYSQLIINRCDVYLGHGYSLISFGNLNHEYFDRYSTITVGHLSLEFPWNFEVANTDDNAPIP